MGWDEYVWGSECVWSIIRCVVSERNAVSLSIIISCHSKWQFSQTLSEPCKSSRKREVWVGAIQIPIISKWSKGDKLVIKWSVGERWIVYGVIPIEIKWHAKLKPVSFFTTQNWNSNRALKICPPPTPPLHFCGSTSWRIEFGSVYTLK